ncbi:50S ribosomal protein L3 [Methanobacterium alcaliphilum]|uniref:50S ribosomal protein L3 n=1 Tax=Methanobacterium alcaliphilum TaxID=392018 RepID=UPI00200A9D3B|nr:50S ribosomal protein L3 [Methanobacterium alcaliphilum]MCK9151310.1 50S ribosomal protein L3 [Methanobacterium alcaliphilum]
MARHHQPRKGSVAFSPRKRAAKETPRIKSWPVAEEPKLLGLAGYKVGMTHVMMVDNAKNSPTEGMEVATPVTILEVPPIFVMGIRAYEKTSRGLKAMGDILSETLNEELKRKISLPKEYNKESALKKIQDNLEYVAEIRVLINTNPKVTSVPKKKPEIFECGVGGKTAEEQLNFALELLGQEISAKDIFSDGEFVDSIAVTKGKGFQGPVKRWGIRIQYGKAARSSKARHVGSIGPWTPSRTMWTVPQAGQMGYHKRTEYNKKILKIGESSEVDAVNPAGGFVKYGLVKNDYIIIKGSIPGPSKRLVILRKAIRAHGKNNDAPQINYISTASKQGV